MKYSITKLTNTSNSNLNYVFKNYPDQLNKTIKDTYFIQLLYTIINKASLQTTEHTCIIHKNVTPSINSNSFLPKEIHTYINETNTILYDIILTIKGIKFSIKIYSTEPIKIDKYIYFIKIILNICVNESHSHSKRLSIILHLTPFKKVLPIKIATPHHINSGFTDGDITIFRKEEWFKVLIHECFHAFCLDFIDVNIDFKKLFNMYHIDSDFLFCESLVEFWARTINIGIVSYYTKKNIDYEEFEMLMQVNISIEQVYSILQMKHILHSFGVTYYDLLKGPSDYKENTNCFCYYVLSALLLSHYEQTMGWFIEHNDTLLQFNKNTQHIYMFYHYIKSIYNSPHFFKLIDEKKEFVLNNICMSVFEIDL